VITKGLLRVYFTRNKYQGTEIISGRGVNIRMQEKTEYLDFLFFACKNENGKKIIWTLADCECHAAAPGLTPLRLPHTQNKSKLLHESLEFT